MISGCLWILMAEMNNCDRGHIACKIKIISTETMHFLQKTLPTPGLNKEKNSIREGILSVVLTTIFPLPIKL